MISFRHKGDFSKVTRFLVDAKGQKLLRILEKCGREGVAALASATPIDTGKTANSWFYKIENSRGSGKVLFCNSNIQNGVPIAIIIQYGHGTRNGGWVEGQDYINPAVKVVFEKMANDAWREVTST